LCFGFSTLVVDANQRSFERGQLVGQCQVVVNLVAAKKRADPSWSPPPGDLMQRCRIALANVREGS
jgi:hypothetical protein